MRSFYWILFVVLIFANVSLYQTIFAPPLLEVHIFDVGKGDATLVRTPSGKTLLIDAGPDASVLRALGSALPMWQRSLDAVILTSEVHGSTGGLPAVTERYRIKSIIRLSESTEHLPLGDAVYLDTVLPIKKAKDPLVLRVSYGSTLLTISSSTPAGVYTLDGKTVK